MKDRPVPAAPIDLAPVTPRLLAEYAEPPIEDVGGSLRSGFWLVIGFWLGVFVVVLICWS